MPDQTAVEVPLCASYASKFKLTDDIRRRDEGTLLRRVNRLIVYYSAVCFCSLDLGDSRPESKRSAADSEVRDPWVSKATNSAGLIELGGGRASRGTNKTHKRRVAPFRMRLSTDAGAGVGPRAGWRRRRLKLGWIAPLLWALFFGCEAYLVLVSLRQYRYDFDKLRLLELQSQQRASEPLGLEIETRMAQSKVEVDDLGSGYSHLTILVECFYMTVAGLGFIIHVPINAHHIFQVPFDYCHVVRDLLNRRREEANVRRLVESQVAEFIQSSRVFHGAACGRDATLSSQGGTRSAHLSGVPPALLGARQGSSHLGRREREVIQMARGMLACGALTPLYKLPDLISTQLRLQFICHLMMTFYAIGFNVALHVGFFSHAVYSGRDSVPFTSNLSIPFACLGCVIISGPTAILHPPVFMVVVREQIHYIDQLRRIIKLCVAQNVVLAAGTGRQSVDRTTAERTMNSNLIFALLHYKIFVAQLAPMRRTLGTVNVVAHAILFTAPLVVRLHQPYISKLYTGHLTSAQIRTFALAICLSVLAPANLVSVPLCHMFARSKDLYHDLASLMAHLKEVNLLRHGESPYDMHAESCLLKELSNPKLLLERLTVRALGISGTYTMLIEALFWYGLIAISILVDTNQVSRGRDWLSSLISDPLRVYAQINL